MLIEVASSLIKLEEETIKFCGKENGEKLFAFIVNTTKFKIRTEQILFELDIYNELYENSIFISAIEFYKTKFKVELTENDKELLEGISQIIPKSKHSNSDEVTLLFYVGLYHKIENYENEILNFYNSINRTEFKTLKSVGIDIPNKKLLFEDRDRIRLICNTIKHNNFYPKKELLKFYPYLKIDEKITLENFNTKEDIGLIKHYVSYFNMLIVFKSFLSAKEKLNELIEKDYSIELDNYFNEFTKDISYKDE
ncbi:MAG: hypothetical protein C0412_21135, partial [Flavobacterium sp.]|nr:hypothetical protein [Flavobacterium sp.]